MQETFKLTLTLRKQSLSKPPFTDVLLVLPKHAIGSYMNQKGKRGRIKLCIPALRYSIEFNSTDSLEEIAKTISFFNLACSLGKCVVNYNFLDANSPDQMILKIEFMSENPELFQFLKVSKEKLNRIID